MPEPAVTVGDNMSNPRAEAWRKLFNRQREEILAFREKFHEAISQVTNREEHRMVLEEYKEEREALVERHEKEREEFKETHG